MRNRLVGREGEAIPLNMFSSNLPNPFLAWEGEAPAEPLRRKLGRSLALPLVSNALDIAKMFRVIAWCSPRILGLAHEKWQAKVACHLNFLCCRALRLNVVRCNHHGLHRDRHLVRHHLRRHHRHRLDSRHRRRRRLLRVDELR